MKADLKVACQAVRIKDPKKMLAFLKVIYQQGFADGADADLCDEEDRFLRIRPNQKFECQCPECGTVLELDIRQLITEVEEQAVKDV